MWLKFNGGDRCTDGDAGARNGAGGGIPCLRVWWCNPFCPGESLMATRVSSGGVCGSTCGGACECISRGGGGESYGSICGDVYVCIYGYDALYISIRLNLLEIENEKWVKGTARFELAVFCV